MSELSKIFDLPLSCIISARRFSGKTYLLKTLLNSDYFKKTFDEIYIFSSTATIDDTWDSLKNKKVVLRDELDLSQLENVLTSLKLDYELSGEKKQVLLIIDDFMDKFSASKNNTLNKIMFKGRHYGLSCIYTTQKYTGLPPLIRNNALVKIVFKMNNKLEFNKFIDENSTIDTPEEELTKLVNTATESKYHYFLVKESNGNIDYYEGDCLKFTRLK